MIKKYLPKYYYISVRYVGCESCDLINNIAEDCKHEHSTWGAASWCAAGRENIAPNIQYRVVRVNKRTGGLRLCRKSNAH